MRITIAAVIAAVAVLALVAGARPSVAQDVPGFCKGTPDEACVAFDLTANLIVWGALDGAASYRVVASGEAVRANGDDPYCTPPLADERRTIMIDETVAAPATTLSMGLPQLPAPDRWFVPLFEVELTVLDANGQPISSGGFAAQGEVGCFDEQTGGRPPATAGSLPNTGAGAGDAETPSTLLLALAAIAFVAGTGGVLTASRR